MFLAKRKMDAAHAFVGADVRYVVSAESFGAWAGRDDLFLLRALSDMNAWVLFFGSLIVFGTVYDLPRDL